jgi:hypothetical protein
MSSDGAEGLLMALAPSDALVEATDVAARRAATMRQIAFAASTKAPLR